MAYRTIKIKLGDFQLVQLDLMAAQNELTRSELIGSLLNMEFGQEVYHGNLSFSEAYEELEKRAERNYTAKLFTDSHLE